uniref:tRNA wybutosine-synthesizing protein 2 homolog isoform X3 n=1 Tax=Callorhinus ursinus TaxID=34884 RepID=A0A3Q7PCT5_CALUR|nr:tRNA wybutosine-synthesizing protein 2 homolog isoform X3 [Callorhinus ursinus]XP_025731599.1 tRNA wybutosine-synthesizing protein 2 homolog isoform X3 [Callorhinus ursinus]
MKQAKTFRMVRAQRLGRRRSNFQGCEPELWETVAVTRGIQGLAKRRWISLYHTYTPAVCCWVNMAGQNMWIMVSGPSLGYHITLLSCLLWLLLTVAVLQNFFVLMTLTVLRSTAQESF